MTEDFKIMTAGDSEKIENLSKINDNLALLNQSFALLNQSLLALSKAVTSISETQAADHELLQQQNKSLEDIAHYMHKIYIHRKDLK